MATEADIWRVRDLLDEFFFVQNRLFRETLNIKTESVEIRHEKIRQMNQNEAFFAEKILKEMR